MNHEPPTNHAGVTQSGRVSRHRRDGRGFVKSVWSLLVCKFEKKTSNSKLTNCFSAGVTQSGRVTAFQAVGRGFESRLPLF
jgi:hypothetical protein